MIVVHRFTALRIAEAYKDDDERGLWCQDDQVLELEAERDKLKVENERQKEAFHNLIKLHEDLRKENEWLRKEIEYLKTPNKDLKEEIKNAIKKRFPDKCDW